MVMGVRKEEERGKIMNSSKYQESAKLKSSPT